MRYQNIHKKRSPSRLIHFFGPDGSGKSVQANILMSYLEMDHVRVKKYWLRAHHTVAYLLWKILVAIGFYRAIVNIYGDELKIPAVNRSYFLCRFWATIEFIGILPLVIRANILLLSGYCLVAERYILDTIAGIAYAVDDPNFPKSWTARMLFCLIPRNTFYIFLDSDYETIRARRSGDNHVSTKGRQQVEVAKPFLEPREFIEFQRSLYGRLALQSDALTIDTSKTSIEETSKIILYNLGLL